MKTMIKTLRIVFFIAVLTLALSGTVHAEKVYSVKYGKIENGKFINAYPKWNKKVSQNQKITTPKVADRADGKRCYWRVNNRTAPVYEIVNGGTYVVTENINFCAVWKSVKTAKCTIKFGNNKNGKFVNSYSKWNKTVSYGQKVVTPKISDRSNGTRCYWRTNNKTSGVNEIVNGGSFIAKGNIDFYAEWKKIYTIKFLGENGVSEISSYRKRLCSGDSLVLPSLDSKKNAAFCGWVLSTNKSGQIYKAGQKIKVNGSLSFSPVYKNTSKKAYLRFNDGTLYEAKCLIGGEKFPSIALSGSQTLQGWSRTPGKRNSPDYLEGDKIPYGTANWYMVVSDRDTEARLNTVAESERYEEVYFVGDSRMEYSKIQFGYSLKTVKFVAKGGIGYDWLVSKGGGYEQLISQLIESEADGKAVVFALGINDLYNISHYLSFYLSVSGELKNLGCDIYVMSVNPFCSAQRTQWKINMAYEKDPENYRTQQLLKDFNESLKLSLKGIYSYIDTNTYLRKTGWTSWDTYQGSTIGDGLHYTVDTNKRVLNYAMSVIG